MEQSWFWRAMERVGIAYAFYVAAGSIMTGLSRWADGNSWTVSIVVGLATVSFLTYLHEKFRPQISALSRKLRNVTPAPPVKIEHAEPERPFLVRFVERQQFYRGVSLDDDDYWVLKIEVVNARPVHVDKLEVFITGETNHLNTSKPLREKIPKQYLKNRRGVDHLNPGQSEEYVLVSIQNDPPFEWWGDHKLNPGQLALIPTDSQHIVEVTVVSSTARSTQKLVLINTYNRQVLPVWPDPTTWIMNTKGPSH